MSKSIYEDEKLEMSNKEISELQFKLKKLRQNGYIHFVIYGEYPEHVRLEIIKIELQIKELENNE